MRILLLNIFIFFTIHSYCQERVTFETSDKLTVVASDYEIDDSYPYIILLHQAGYSKGEYKNTAIKLLKLGYNCLAVDLRSGQGVNFIQNETAQNAKELNLNTDYLSTEPDILAAIDYAYNKSNKPVILFGSSYSASLALKIGRNNPKVKAVVAFSPGEYFLPDMVVKDQLSHYDKPVFVACSQREFTYMEDLLSGIPENLKTIFKPQDGPGEHGSKALWENSPSSKEYWLALLLFFKNI